MQQDRVTVERNRHLKAKDDEITYWQTRSHTGINSLCETYPELADLIQALSDAEWYAQVGKAKTINPDSRGNPDPIAPSGMTLTAGKDTYTDRKRLDRIRRWVDQLTEKIRVELDPHNHRKPDDRPRHQAKDCPGNGKRQPHGTLFCRFCGIELKSKPKAKRPIPQVK